MRYAQFWSVIAVASISTGVAAAEDNLKGTYAFTGTQVCLTAPAGFKEDSKGNLAIPDLAHAAPEEVIHPDPQEGNDNSAN